MPGEAPTAESLARRPSHVPAPEQVDMQVVDALATVLASVDDRAVAGLGDALLARERGGHGHHLAEQIRVGEVIQ